MGEPGHDVECCLYVCAGLCCVCAQVPALSCYLEILMTRVLIRAAAAQFSLGYGGLLSGMVRAGTS